MKPTKPKKDYKGSVPYAYHETDNPYTRSIAPKLPATFDTARTGFGCGMISAAPRKPVLSRPPLCLSVPRRNTLQCTLHYLLTAANVWFALCTLDALFAC